MFDKFTRTTPYLLIAAMAALLNGCGGGGSSSGGCSTLDPSRDPSLPGCTGTTTPGTMPAATTLALTLTDSAGASITSVTSERQGTVRAVLKDSKGVALPGVALTFVTTDSSATLVPSSGTALTDAGGAASIGLPAGTQAGTFTVTASASAGATATAKKSYTVTFPSLTLSALVATPSTLPAGGNASVSTTVQSAGAAYAPIQSVSFSSPCATAGKATLSSPVLTQNGVATTSYTDKGCGVADVITANTTLAGTTVSSTGTINVLPATAGSFKFLSADTTNIALKGSGGFGRQEFSTLTFQVFDTAGQPVSGKLIDFVFSDTHTTSTTGGLTLSPASATSGSDGKMTTIVSAGTIPTSVRVIASVRGSAPMVTTLSNILVISTGVPDQAHFSLSTSNGNCEGLNIDQHCATIKATLGDHFGNPVPDGTAVSFTAEGGVIGASCVTGSLPEPGATPSGQTTNSSIGPGSGSCSVEFRSSNPRPANGRVTIRAYALGEENFVDNNNNNVYDSGDTFTDKSPDIFRDDNEDGALSSNEPCIGPNLNGTCTTPGDGQYNGVLRSPQVASAQALYISSQLVEFFSGSNAVVTVSPTPLTCPANGSADVQVRVVDVLGNVMPSGSKVEFSAAFGATAATVVPDSVTVPNVILGVGQPLIVPTYSVTMACATTTTTGKFTVKVTTPSGVITTTNFNVN